NQFSIQEFLFAWRIREAEELLVGETRDNAHIHSLVLRHAGVDLLAPGEDAALHVANVLEAVGPQDAAGAGAPHTCIAVDYDIGVGVEFPEALADFTERNELGPGDVADLVFVRLADIDEHEVIAAIQHLLHFGHFDLAFGHFLLLLRSLLRDAAEL